VLLARRKSASGNSMVVFIDTHIPISWAFSQLRPGCPRLRQLRRMINARRRHASHYNSTVA
jgi:hypothetical protein